MLSSDKNVPVFVTGTDTGIGKTVVSLLLMHFFYEKGWRPFYLKPFQTGCSTPQDTQSDALFIYRHIKQLNTRDPAESVIYCFGPPKAPLFAAREEKKRIDLDLVERIISQKRTVYAPLIIEGAGGLLVPVTRRLLMVDLIEKFSATPVLVARAGLGTINHTLLSIEALAKRGLKPVQVFFVDAGEKETPPNTIRENMAAVKEFSGVKAIGVIGKIENFSSPPEEVYKEDGFIDCASSSMR